ncbi:hypothetical protein [Brevibacillus laterosporus]|uniref:hypothetical protein n=1 Tax=Brevibacillus laterosporus TaxID=1465 RepID=UPI00215D44E8|nr:hypothetical protein [Brevibacillus laterosporus]MCR8994685.1 hypothetical protein [Brevibacillus laterosporus]
MDSKNEEIELYDIRVGQKFPLFSGSTESLKGKDGAHFEATDLNQGYFFCIHFTNISFKELKTFKESSISMRILQGNDHMVIPMIKFGNAMTFEMVFDPTLYSDNRALQFTETNNILTIFLIDSDTGVLKGIRKCNLPLKMIQICKSSWARAIINPHFSEQFNEWVARMSNYPVETLWERATYVGKLGETYNIEEIKYPFY